MTNGLVVMTPSSIAYSGTSASINADGSVTFSACTSLSLNGVFTGDYDNYMVVVRATNGTSSIQYQFRFRSSGTDNSTANSYVRQYIGADGATVDAGRQTGNIGSFIYTNSTSEIGFTQYVFGPYLAQPTAYRSTTVNATSSAGIIDYAGTHNQSTSYDGITAFPQAGNFTGLLTVFGFNQ
jgi:hypothetical protein